MMKSTFAHMKVGKVLHSMGIMGWFSFNLIGLQAYLRYCMIESAGKLQTDLDKEPFCFPKISYEALLAQAKKENPQQDARNKVPSTEKDAKKQKVRTQLTFVELTNLFVENNVRFS